VVEPVDPGSSNPRFDMCAHIFLDSKIYCGAMLLVVGDVNSTAKCL